MKFLMKNYFLISIIFNLLCGLYCSLVEEFRWDENTCLENMEPLIESSNGRIAGRCVKVYDTEVASFMGIPFAKPPVGEKRFSKPEPIDNWQGTLFAKEKPPACMQFSSRNFSWIPSTNRLSEDCLYLNIWTPNGCCNKKMEKLAVMVWIHGGGYYAGSSSMDLYDGAILAVYGRVVVVSINYRLGLFGFFNGGNEEAPGNVGLYDQRLSLQWINTNIEHFGGDSKRITLFGESAGSMSINLHLVSPISQNLFHRAIMQSGISYHPHLVDDPNVSIFKSNTLSEIVGCSNKETSLFNKPIEVLNCLKEKNAAELAQMENIFTSKFPMYFIPYFGATCTGCNDFLPEAPIKMMNSIDAKIPTLLGNNRDEGSIFLSYIMPEVFITNQTTELSLPLAKQIIKGLFSTAPEIPSEVVFDYYFKEVSPDNSNDIVKTISNAFGDYVFVCPSMFYAEQAEPYVYWMTHRSKKDTTHDWVGVTHFEEVKYVFGKPIERSDLFTRDDKIFSRDILEKWVNFARDGYIKEETASWRKFSKLNPVVYELNLQNTENPKTFPRLEACKFWRPYFAL